MENEELRKEPAEAPRVVFRKDPAEAAAGEKAEEPTTEEIKERIAAKVREDSEEHAGMTQAETVFALVPRSRKDDITAILDEMAKAEPYADIKAVTTPSGMVFFFSTARIDPEIAVAKSRSEEIKITIAKKVREDSRDRAVLSPEAGLLSLMPDAGREEVEAALEEMLEDARYDDLKSATAATGERFFHSSRHMSGYYAGVLCRLAGKDLSSLIASVVRDESRIYPRSTCLQLFMEKPFEIPPCDMKAVVEETLSRPEYGDLKMIVHPSTGGVYLYSDRYLDERSAAAYMDWQEVGQDENP